MADLFSPALFDADTCKIKTAGTGDAIDPKHIVVDPDNDNILTNDPVDGLKVVAEDFISKEEGNLAKKSLADGGVLVKAADMVSDAECNALSVTQDGKLALIPEDLISDVMGGNPLGINPDDCKLYINPCLLPGPQNIVSKDEDNLIVEDPDDCSALLKYQHVVSADAGNLIEPGSDGKLSVTFQDIVDKQYFGAGLVFVERQDGSKVLQVAACNGLTFQEGTKTDVRGNSYYAKWLTVDLDENQNLLYFVSGDGCTECFEGCGQLSIEFGLNANGQWLRILDHNGNVYKRISLNNGLTASSDGGLTINTQDTIATTAPDNDLPISSKAIVAYSAPKYHANADKTIYGGGTGSLYGHVKLTDSLTDGTHCEDSSIALSACAGKQLKDMIDAIDLSQYAPIPHDDTTKKYGGGTSTNYGHVKLTDRLDLNSCADTSIGLSACAGKQLKDLIDQIIGPDDPDDPGSSDTRKAIYDFRVKNFEARTVSATIAGTIYLIVGEIHFPKVNNSRMDGVLTMVSDYESKTDEGVTTYSMSYGPKYFYGRTNGADTGYIVAIAVSTLSASERTTMVSDLNTAAGTLGLPMAELAHYRVTNRQGSRPSPVFFLVAANEVKAADIWYLIDNDSNARDGRSGTTSNSLTGNEVTTYTKAYVDYE